MTSPQGLAGLWFEGQQHHPHAGTAAGWLIKPAHPWLRAATQQIDDYFAGRRQRFDLPLDLSGGTAFQQSVWRELLNLPFGQTCSYGDLARRMGRPGAARAVGAGVGRNPLSIVVPCHRVLGASGELTGYAGGLERKRALLRLECDRSLADIRHL
ncbi:MAG: methylated-DNA--[protein]-cysteine S-methyltransferase [Hydrogenophaga sp.]